MWLVVAVLAGCSLLRTTPPGAPTDTPTHRRTILRQNGFFEVRIEAPDVPAGPKPAVLSFVDEFRKPLLAAGVVIVSYVVHWELLRGLPKATPTPPEPPPDAPAPKTVGKWLLASPSPGVIGKGYFGLLAGNAHDTIPQVLDAIATDPDIDPKRLGIVGFSTNGFVALLATAGNPRLRVAVAVAACGDFHRFLHRSTLAMNGEPLALDPDYDRWLRSTEPIRHPLRLVHAAVLMVNGRTDLPVPIACAEATAVTLRKAYATVGAPDRYRFVVIDQGHAMGEQAQREALDWIDRWLVRSTRDASDREDRHADRWPEAALDAEPRH